jgi:hypothetical protein
LQAPERGVDIRIDDAEVERVDRGIDERVHATVGEAEDALEVAARRQLVERDEIVAVLRGIHVRPHHAAYRVVRRQLVPGDDRERAAAGEVDPPEVADEGEVRRRRGEREPACERPIGIRRRARAVVAVDPDRGETRLVRLRRERHGRAQRSEPTVALEVIERS